MFVALLNTSVVCTIISHVLLVVTLITKATTTIHITTVQAFPVILSSIKPTQKPTRSVNGFLFNKQQSNLVIQKSYSLVVSLTTTSERKFIWRNGFCRSWCTFGTVYSPFCLRMSQSIDNENDRTASSRKTTLRKRDWLLSSLGLRSISNTTIQTRKLQRYRKNRKQIKLLRKKEQERAVAINNTRMRISSNTKYPAKNSIAIQTVDQLHSHWLDPDYLFRKSSNESEINYSALVRAASVIGQTQVIGSKEHKDYVHPVAQLMHHRRRSGTTKNEDGFKIALAIEGGGMRGCISAGMVCAIHYLNLTSTIDAIYGSSAGTIVGSYLSTGQLPWFGPELYYDQLTTAGRDFIDTRRLLRAIGLGLLDPRLYKDVLFRPTGGKPVLNLNFLLKQTVQGTKKLNWDRFLQLQTTQPLHVVVSALKEERSIALRMSEGAFTSLDELTDAMHASCLLPGIAGPIMNVHKNVCGFNKNEQDRVSNVGGSLSSETNRIPSTTIATKQKYILGNELKDPEYEPLADALLFEPIPYRSAIQDGATHVLVIRSRPDGVDVTGSGAVYENMISHRFFVRKNNLPAMHQRLKQQLHKKLYGEDVILLNNAAYTPNRPYNDEVVPDIKSVFKNSTNCKPPHLMAMAVGPGLPEVTRLEVGRLEIFEGLRRGFARAYDCLVEDPNQRGRGVEVAKLYFPDEIMNYDPLEIAFTEETTNASQSAFETYMIKTNVSPRAWDVYYGNDNGQINDNKRPLHPPPASMLTHSPQ